MGTFILFIFGLMFIVGIISVIARFVGDGSFRKKSKKTLDEVISQENIQNYEWQQFDKGQIILLDHDESLIYFIDGLDWRASYTSSIIDSELNIDNSTMIKTSLSSATGRAVAGGLLAGGVGAVVGGMTAGKSGREKIHLIELIITFSDGRFERITAFQEDAGVTKDTAYYQQTHEQAFTWAKKMEAIIYNNQR